MTDEIDEKITRLQDHAWRIVRQGGGGPPDDRNPRLDYLEARVDRVEGKLDTIIERLGAIATKADMRTYLLTGIALFLAIVGILVAAIGWLETRAARIEPAAAPPTPMIFQILPSSAAPVAASKPGPTH